MFSLFTVEVEEASVITVAAKGVTLAEGAAHHFVVHFQIFTRVSCPRSLNEKNVTYIL